MRQTPFYNFFILALLVTMTVSVSAQQVDSKLPWSVRLTESEMIRYPQSWQLDFQPKLKWDYCHGLELGAMLDVYDTYGDKKIRDYAIAYHPIARPQVCFDCPVTGSAQRSVRLTSHAWR